MIRTRRYTARFICPRSYFPKPARKDGYRDFLLLECKQCRNDLAAIWKFVTRQTRQMVRNRNRSILKDASLL